MGKSLTAAVLIALAALSAPTTAHAAPASACQFEDGNPDGTACDWTDPDTGDVFHVEAHTYGDPACSDICLGA